MRTVSAFFFAAFLFVAAAESTAAQMQFGVRAGATISDISLDSDGIEPAFDSRTGFNLAAYLDIPLSGGLFFQPGLGFTQKGAKLTGEFEGEEISVGINLDYVEVPLLFRYAFPTTGSLGVHLLAGPAFSFESGCTLEIESEGVRIEADCDQSSGEDEFEADTESFDYGAMFGGGLTFPIAGATGTFEALYNAGLRNIAGGGGEDSSKNRALYITAGIRIPIGG